MDEYAEMPTDQPMETPGPAKRHGCVTAWLILLILGGAFTIFVQPGMLDKIQEVMPDFPSWVIWPLAFLGFLNIVFAVAVFG